MPSSLPPLTWFRAFESAARHLSFTKAAQELNLTQSAISQHVRALEDRLACPLFIRKHRALELTDQGRRMVPPIAAALEGLKQATGHFETPTHTQTLTVSASLSVARWHIFPHLKDFTDRAPNVAVRLATKTWPDEFSGGDEDVEIRFDSPQSANNGATLLGPNAMVVVASTEFQRANQNCTATPEQIGKLPSIHVLGTTDTWQAWAETHNVPTPRNVVAYVESHANAVDLALSGLGVAYTSKLIATPSLRNGNLVQLLPQTQDATDGYYMRLTNGPNQEMAALFGQWLTEKIASNF